MGSGKIAKQLKKKSKKKVAPRVRHVIHARPNYLGVFVFLGFLNIMGWLMAFVIGHGSGHHPVYWVVITLISCVLNIAFYRGMVDDSKDLVYKVEHEVK